MIVWNENVSDVYSVHLKQFRLQLLHIVSKIAPPYLPPFKELTTYSSFFLDNFILLTHILLIRYYLIKQDNKL